MYYTQRQSCQARLATEKSPHSKADSIRAMPFLASSRTNSASVRWTSCLKAGMEPAFSFRYRRGSSASTSLAMDSLSFSTATVYSEASIRRCVVELMGVETSNDGIIVSAMAIKVVQCEGVRISPSGSGGNGLASGANTSICFDVMVAVVQDVHVSTGTSDRGEESLAPHCSIVDLRPRIALCIDRMTRNQGHGGG